jgi:hypothetical protein
MPRAERRAQDGGQLAVHADGRGGRIAARVHVLDGRRPHHVHLGLLQQLAVGVEGARILVEVLVGPELQRVDEDADDHAFAQLARLVDQADVAGVQIAHGRHERDGLARAAPGLQGGVQLGNGVNDLH